MFFVNPTTVLDRVADQTTSTHSQETRLCTCCAKTVRRTLSSLSPDEGPGGRQARALKVLCFTKARAEGKGRDRGFAHGVGLSTARVISVLLQISVDHFYRAWWTKRRMARREAIGSGGDCGKLQTHAAPLWGG